MKNATDEIFSVAAESSPVGATQRQQLDSLALEVIQIDNRIARLEEEVKALNVQKHELTLRTIPLLLQSVGIKEYVSIDNIEVAIKPVVSGSLPKDSDKRNAAIQYLRTIGGESLFRSDVSIAFGKGQEQQAQQVLEAIGKLGFNHAEISTDIHSQTLCAFVRERMEKNQPTEVEKLGVYVANHAKVKMRKEKVRK